MGSEMCIRDREAFALMENRLLDKGDFVMLCQARQELLRALIDEIPAQMTKDDDGFQDVLPVPLRVVNS